MTWCPHLENQPVCQAALPTPHPLPRSPCICSVLLRKLLSFLLHKFLWKRGKTSFLFDRGTTNNCEASLTYWQKKADCTPMFCSSYVWGALLAWNDRFCVYIKLAVAPVPSARTHKTSPRPHLPAPDACWCHCTVGPLHRLVRLPSSPHWMLVPFSQPHYLCHHTSTLVCKSATYHLHLNLFPLAL